jgi:hypothetical protein
MLLLVSVGTTFHTDIDNLSKALSTSFRFLAFSKSSSKRIIVSSAYCKMERPSSTK